MRQFYIEDKQSGHAFMGMAPQDERNCKPMDYYRYSFAHARAKMYQLIAQKKEGIPIGDESFSHMFALRETDNLIAKILEEGRPNKNLVRLLEDTTLPKRKQEQLLRGLKMEDWDILWWNVLAHRQGYLLDILHVEVLPEKFKEMKQPVLCAEQPDGSIVHIGDTDMTDGEMRAMMQQRKVMQLRIYHKDDIFHCFYFTYRGIGGMEPGELGAQPHYHYVSNKWNVTREQLCQNVEKGVLPESKVHIIIKRNTQGRKNE